MADTETPADAKRERPDDETANGPSAADDGPQKKQKVEEPAKEEEPKTDEASPSENKEDTPATDAAEKVEPAKTDEEASEAKKEGEPNSGAAPVDFAAPAPAPVPAGLPPGVPAGDSAKPVDPTAVATVSNPNSIIEERGEVSPLYVGRVIGKGGEMIRDLQARAGCRIDVDQQVPPGQPRVITYRGTREQIDFAKHLVQLLCRENATDADLPLGNAKREYLVVPGNSVGKIIGRGGEMIRELQSRSQCKIQVDHSGSAGVQQDEKQVMLTGTEQAVTKAKEMVLFLVANPLFEGMQGIQMLVEEKLRGGGVWGSGPPYLSMPNQGQNMQPNSGNSGGYGGYGQQAYGYAAGGSGGGYGAPAPAGGYGAASQAYAPAAAAPAAYGGQYGAQAAGGGGMEMEMFMAAKTYMGRIIGQKGVTINDLQRRSSCDIQINQDVAPGQDCEITIKGTRQGIETAKSMLREIIEVGPGHPYAGGHGGGGSGGYQQCAYGGQQSYGGYPQQQQAYGGGYQAQAPAPAYGQTGYQSQGYQGSYQAPQANAYGGQQAQSQYGSVPSGYPPAPAPAAAGPWKSATAADGQTYYYNEQTGATQWDKPAGMP